VNDVPDGFKMTELGPLPEVWKVVKIGDLFEMQQGKALSKKAREGVSPHPFLRTSNVMWGHVDLSSLDQMDFTDNELKRLTLQRGDLLVCEGGDIGRTAIWRGEVSLCCHQNHIHRLRTTRSDVSPEYYMYWMQAAIRLFHLYVAEGNKTTIPNLSKARLSNFTIPHPPLQEQQTIARMLSTVQEAREKTEAAIDATRELKKSLMKHLFTYGPVPLQEADKVPLKETEIGLVPEDWGVARLGDYIQKTQYGMSLRGNQVGQYPILRMNCLLDGHVDTLDLQYVDLDEKEFYKFKLNKGDVLFNRTNSFELVGKTALFDLEGDFVFASYLVRIIPETSKMVPDYLNYHFNWSITQSRLKMLASRGVSQSNINATKLRSFQVPIPPLFEQQQIAHILSSVDCKIEAQENKKAALDSLFQTLLQNLMTAKIRVNHMGEETCGN
jgi:type I restriction enzyme S subunit